MANAKEELLDAVKYTAKIKCALIKQYDYKHNKFLENIILKTNHSKMDYEQFLEDLDFEYDSGYGLQELYGIIWLEDGSWFSRGEYDGSEWWERNVLPTIPAECLSNWL